MPNVWPAVTASVAIVSPPNPPNADCPCAPRASTCTCVTPPGTVQDCAAPVYPKLTVVDAGAAAAVGSRADGTDIEAATRHEARTDPVDSRRRYKRIGTSAKRGLGRRSQTRTCHVPQPLECIS